MHVCFFVYACGDIDFDDFESDDTLIYLSGLRPTFLLFSPHIQLALCARKA